MKNAESSRALDAKDDDHSLLDKVAHRYLQSSSVNRLTRIIGHLLPGKNVGPTTATRRNLNETVETTTVEENFAEPLLYFRDLFCFEFAGNCNQLTVENANQYIHEFTEDDSLRRSLLNTNNDVCQFSQVFQRLVMSTTTGESDGDRSSSEGDSHDYQSTLMRCEIHGHACATEIASLIDEFCRGERLLDGDSSRFHSSMQNNPLSLGTVCYFSGHGRLNPDNRQLSLSLAKGRFDNESEELVPFNFIFKQFQRRKQQHSPLLFILECCHSGAAVESHARFNELDPNDSVFMIASCSSMELSGAWIMDGMDSNAIMTKMLTDPIGTYFKINFQVFYDFGGDWLQKNCSATTTRKSNQRTLYELYDKYSEMMMEEWMSNDPGNINVKALMWIRSHCPHIYILFKNLMLLVRYGHKLHMPQSVVSFPDLSPTAQSQYWTNFEQEVESFVIRFWENRSHVRK